VAIEKYEQAMDDIRVVNAKFGRSDNATIYNKWLGKGILRMDHEDYLMASKYFQKAWRKFPANKDAYLLQAISIVNSYSYSLAGYCMDQQIKYEKVRETKNFLSKAIQNCNTRKRESSLYFFRGLLNFQLHNFYDALCDFNSAISEDEEPTAAFYLARGRTYACLSILKEAMKDLSIALNLDQSL
jgi:tetratricopeptide (TPR) repeat protein